MSYFIFILLCACLKWPNESFVGEFETPESILSQNITKSFHSNTGFACSKTFCKIPPISNTILTRGKYLPTLNSLCCSINITSEFLILPFVEILPQYITPQKVTIDYFQNGNLILFNMHFCGSGALDGVGRGFPFLKLLCISAFFSSYCPEIHLFKVF